MTLTQNGPVRSLSIAPGALAHGPMLGIGSVHPWLSFELGMGFTSADGVRVTRVDEVPSYDPAFADGRPPRSDLSIYRAQLLIGPRLPLGYFALAGGLGVGVDVWSAAPADTGAEARGAGAGESVTRAKGVLPAWTRLSVKPACGFALHVTATYSVGLAAISGSYPSFLGGIAYETCTGRETSAARRAARSTLGVAPTAAPAGPMQAQLVDGLGPPELVIFNMSDAELTLRISGPDERTVGVAPRGRLELRVAPGRYSFAASAPGAASDKGSYVFAVDHRYTWSFSIAAGAP